MPYENLSEERKLVDKILGISTLLGVIVLISLYFYNEPIFIEDELKPYYNDFKAQAKQFNVKITPRVAVIFFFPLEDGIAGDCSFNQVTTTIRVNSNYWRHHSEEEKAMILYHEMGHCYLKRDHIAEVKRFNLILSKQCPTSIMYPSVEIINNCLVDNWEYYMVELFTNPNNFPTF